MKRLQSEVEVEAALNALVDRVDLTDTGIRVSLKLPNSATEEPSSNARLIRLAFLASKIVEAIATGHQPPELTTKALTERIELPRLWTEQEGAVGIS